MKKSKQKKKRGILIPLLISTRKKDKRGVSYYLGADNKRVKKTDWEAFVSYTKKFKGTPAQKRKKAENAVIDKTIKDILGKISIETAKKVQTKRRATVRRKKHKAEIATEKIFSKSVLSYTEKVLSGEKKEVIESTINQSVINLSAEMVLTDTIPTFLAYDGKIFSLTGDKLFYFNFFATELLDLYFQMAIEEETSVSPFVTWDFFRRVDNQFAVIFLPPNLNPYLNIDLNDLTEEFLLKLKEL